MVKLSDIKNLTDNFKTSGLFLYFYKNIEKGI